MNDQRSLNSLYAIVFINAFVFGLIVPLVPLHALELGASDVEIGIIGSLGALTTAFLPLFFGRLSEKTGRKALMFPGLATFGLVCAGYGSSLSINQIMSIKIFEGLSSALFWSPSDALAGDLAPIARRGHVAGRFGIAWSLGFILGPFTGGVMMSMIGFRASMYVSAVLMLPCLLLLYRHVAEPLRKPVSHSEAHRILGLGDPSIRPILPAMLIYGFVGGIFYSLFPAYAAYLGFTASEIGSLLSFLSLSRTLSFVYISRILAQMGKSRSMRLGGILLGIPALLLGALTGFIPLAVLLTCIGLGQGLVYSVAMVIMFGSSAKGEATGALESSIGTGWLVGPLIGGYAAEALQPLPYLTCAIISLLGLTMLSGKFTD